MGDPAAVICKIVCLEAFFCPIPKFESKHNNIEVEIFEKTPRDDQEVLRQRLRNADVAVITTIPLNAEILAPESTPNLKAIMVMSVGTDNVDLRVCKERNIKVFNCPAANADSVSEHAIGLYFTLRRRIVELHHRTLQGEWVARGSLIEKMRDRAGNAPLSLKDEKAGIIGYGSIGRRIASLCTALGMSVSIAGRKGHPTSHKLEDGRESFEDVVRQSTVLFICVPLTADTKDLVATSVLELMQQRAILINVSRGGVVNEGSLVLALKQGVFAGAATDVFASEPAGPGNSPLLQDWDKHTIDTLPLVVSPHTAWYSQGTIANLQRTVKTNVEGWLAGNPPLDTIVV